MEFVHSVVYSFDPSTRVITNLNDEVLNADPMSSYTIPEYLEDRETYDHATVVSSNGSLYVFSDGRTELLAQQIEEFDPCLLNSIREYQGLPLFASTSQARAKDDVAALTPTIEAAPRSEGMGSFSVLKQLENARGLLSVEQLIEILGPGFKKSTIYAMTDRPAPAGMPCIRFGAKKMFEPATLIHWFKQHNPYMAVARKVSLKAEHAVQELNRPDPRQ